MRNALKINISGWDENETIVATMPQIYELIRDGYTISYAGEVTTEERVVAITHCTKDQARNLINELNKYPKCKDIFINKMDEFEFNNADELKVVPLLGYMTDSINIVVERKATKYTKSYVKYGIDSLFKDRVFISNY